MRILRLRSEQVSYCAVLPQAFHRVGNIDLSKGFGFIIHLKNRVLKQDVSIIETDIRVLVEKSSPQRKKENTEKRQVIVK